MSADGRDLRSDEVLLVAIGEADRGALTVLYHRHAAWLTVRLTHRCGDADVVDLALQDTFVAVWRKPARIAVRARSRRGCGASRCGASSTSSVAGRRWRTGRRSSSWWCRPRTRCSSGFDHGELAGALDRLSPELVSVVQATVLDGLSTREAARLLRIPTGHRQEPDGPRPGPAERGTGMTSNSTWHADQRAARRLRRRHVGSARRRRRSRPT